MSAAVAGGDRNRIELHLYDSGLGSFGSESDTSPNGPVASAAAAAHSNPQQAGADCPVSTESSVTSMSFMGMYYGEAVLDRRHTSSMLPWVVAGLRRRGDGRPVLLVVASGSLKAVGVASATVQPVTLFEHQLSTVTRFSRMRDDPLCFSYAMRPSPESPFTSHAFRASDESMIQTVFDAVRRATVNMPRDTSISDMLCASSHLYEVLYIGKVVVSTKKAPPTFIDDAVSKFDEYAKQQARTGGDDLAGLKRRRLESDTSVQSLPADLERIVTIRENELYSQSGLKHQTGNHASGDGTLSSGSDDAFHGEKSADHTLENSDESEGEIGNAGSHESLYDCKISAEPVPSFPHPPAVRNPNVQRLVAQHRVRAVSECKEQRRNRTMLIQVGQSELALISLDRKSVIFERQFKDISFCSQGITHPEHFGFISRDPESGNFTCYVFRCASESVVEEVMVTLKMAFQSAFQQIASHRNLVVCELCPMHQFHKLCQQIDKMTVDQIHETLHQCVQQLNEDDQAIVKSKLPPRSDGGSTHDMNELVMSALLSLSELKQHDHVHLGDIGRSTQGKYDFILSQPPAEKLKASKFDGFSWRSIGSSLEHLFKGRSTPEENPTGRDRRLTASESGPSAAASLPVAPPVDRKPAMHDQHPSHLADSRGVDTKQRRYSTPHRLPQLFGTAMLLESCEHDGLGYGNHDSSVDPKPRPSIPHDSPMRSMFAKVGNGTKAVTGRCPPGAARYRGGGGTTGRSKSASLPPVGPMYGSGGTSWRLGGLSNVRGFPTLGSKESDGGFGQSLAGIKAPVPTKKMRALWQKAILETLLLIRMNKENQTLSASNTSEPSHPVEASRRVRPSPQMVLDYDEITPCLKEVTKVWEQMLCCPDRASTKFDWNTLANAVKDGVPRTRRGEIWELLVEQHRLHRPGSPVCGDSVKRDTSSEQYHDLLKQLTLHQHAILIDLGRTFPAHPYFSAQLGPGQLSLFNLLKAYSLLDEEVGYCQGLSFIAGVLLMHISEQKAFDVMKYLMFELGFRRQYRPDMVSLQIQMYQLSRLLHDYHKDLYDHFEVNEIAPTLYAAPWFLTLFASQFPLGFVARVFDLIFLDGMEVVLKVSLALLGNLKELIKQCIGFESIVEFLKSTLPEMGIIQLERVINQVFAMDISKQLEAYEVEYHILQEEMSASLNATAAAAYACGSKGGRDSARSVGSGSSPEVDSGSDQVLRLQAANEALRRQQTELLEQLQMSRRQNHALEEQNQMLVSNERKLHSHIRALELERTALLGAVTALRRMVPPPVSGSGGTIPEIRLSTENPTDSSTDETARSPLADLDREVAALMAARSGELDIGPKNCHVVKGSRVLQLQAERPASANC